MNKLISAAVGACALMFTSSIASAMTDAECLTAFKTADTNADGALSDAEGRRYFAAMRVAQRPVAADSMTQAAFMENCKADVFAAAATDAAAPLPGSNSFTQAQAEDRAIAAGLTNVSALTKDDKGVWRGTAAQGAKTVNVAVDFKGNVVIN
jgi:hypothetical protein